MNLILILGFLLLAIGLWGMLTQKNMIKIVIGLTIAEVGVQLVMISVGYIKGKTAPILDSAVPLADAANKVVDPVPQALVLTAIVIGVAVNALILSFIVKIYNRKKSLSINDYKEMKW